MSITIVALLHGPDQSGLVARTAGWIYERHGNILHADQHRDMHEGIFFQRIEWVPADPGKAQEEMNAFRSYVESLGMEAQIRSSDHRFRIAILVSKFDHVLRDILWRHHANEYECDIPLIISNHKDLEPIALDYGIPFHHIPVTAETKAESEAKQLKLLSDNKIDLAIMARYMQVLSGDFLRKFAKPVINIHHSFLPAFAGSKPYHQAAKRGVKLIGATAHYATEVLDDGPIIQQDVTRITHRHTVDDLIRKGRDLERIVLAQALRWHLDSRILAYGNKTVIFD